MEPRLLSCEVAGIRGCAHAIRDSAVGRGDSDGEIRMRSVPDQVYQPIHISFPSRVFGRSTVLSTSRSFQATWFHFEIKFHARTILK